MTDEEVGAIWRDECTKADHITWAATAFARRIEAVERERIASACWDRRGHFASDGAARAFAELVRAGKA